MSRKPITQPWTDDNDPRRIQMLAEQGYDKDMLPPDLNPIEKEVAMADPTPAPGILAPVTHTSFGFKLLVGLGTLLTAVAAGAPDIIPGTPIDQYVALVAVFLLGLFVPSVKDEIAKNKAAQ